MNIREALLQEHSKKQTTRIVKYIGSDAQRFSELMKLFLGDEYRVTQRAAWVVSGCAEEHPSLIKPHFQKLVTNLDKLGLHDAVKRNTLKVLSELDVPVKLQGKLVNTCFRMLASQEPVAVKAHAMSIVANICKAQPDLKNELRMAIEEQLPYGSAAIRSRGNKILKQLEKL